MQPSEDFDFYNYWNNNSKTRDAQSSYESGRQCLYVKLKHPAES